MTHSYSHVAVSCSNVAVSNNVEVSGSSVTAPNSSSNHSSTGTESQGNANQTDQDQTSRKSLRHAKIAHINIRSLRNKVEDIQELLLRNDIMVLGVSETWLDDAVSNSEVSVPGYHLIRRDRPKSKGGGVCVYYRFDLSLREHNFPATAECHEMIWLTIGWSRTDTVQLCFAYRPPDSPAVFWEALSNVTESQKLSSKHPTIILGDFNANAFDPESYHCKRMHEYCRQNDLVQCVRDPTHWPNGTCLDLVLASSDTAQKLFVSCTPVTCSDHSLVIARYKCNPKVKQKVVRTRRRMDNVDMNKFKNDISNAVSELDETADLNRYHTDWQECISSLLDSAAPTVTSSQSFNNCPAPWRTPEFRVMQRSRDRAHRQFLLHRSPEKYKIFADARRTVLATDRSLKNTYFHSQCQAARQNPKQQWRLINTVSKRAKWRPPPTAPVNELSATFGGIVQDPLRPQNLSIPYGPASAQDLVKFPHVTIAEVHDALSCYDGRKATGSDGIPAMVLRGCADELSPSVTHLINGCLSTGQMPTAMKIAAICPVYKAGDPATPNNYRPVSLLPIVSKIIETFVAKSLREYIESKPDMSILPPEQFAYRARHSCEDALCLATDRWNRALDQGMITGTVFCDMSKAFDRVEHQGLIFELHKCGIGGTALEWFANYLENRSQYVVIGPEKSEYSSCTRGVPQGSVLGPVLFSIYIRSIPSLLANYRVQTQLFADDILFYSSGTDPCEISEILSAALQSLEGWLTAKGLLLNPAKTQLMYVRSRHRVVPEDAKVSVRGIELQRVSSAKYLGVHLDEFLTFDTQVGHLQRKISKKIGALSRCFRSMDMTCRRTYYLSLIQSDLEYASNCYIGNLSAANLERLVKISKSAVRAAFGAKPWHSTRPLFSRLDLMNIESRYYIKSMLFTFRCIHSLASQELSSMFTPRSSRCTGRTTRGMLDNSLILPNVSTSYGMKALSFYAADRWNMLPAAVRISNSAADFHAKISGFLGHPVRGL